MAKPKSRFERVRLKKQSQFAGGQNGVMPVISMFYGDFGLWGRRENKANQSQFQTRQVFVDRIKQIYYYGI